MFIDESGEASVKNNDNHFDIFSLCGVVLSEPSYYILNQKMNELKLRIWGSKDVVFHSYEMRRRLNAFKIFQDKNVLNDFYIGMEDVLKNCNYEIICCVVKKDMYKVVHPSRNSAYETSLQYICERAAFMMNRKKNCEMHICLEKRNRDKNRALYKNYITLLNRGNQWNHPDTFIKLNKELHFRDKNENVNGLQLSDICAYPIAYKILNPSKEQPTFEIIKQKLHRFDGNVDGFGLKIFPKKPL